jgi:hypothetical protein
MYTHKHSPLLIPESYFFMLSLQLLRLSVFFGFARLLLTRREATQLPLRRFLLLFEKDFLIAFNLFYKKKLMTLVTFLAHV